jgi:hypothetical protein
VGFIRFSPLVSHDEEAYLRHFYRTQVAVLRRVRVEIRFLVGTPFNKSSLSRRAIFTPGSPRTRFTRTASSSSALALNTVIFPHGLAITVDELVSQHPLAHLKRRDHARRGYIEHPNDERPHDPRRRGGRSLRATREQTRGGLRSPFRRLCACEASWARHVRDDVSRVHFFI